MVVGGRGEGKDRLFCEDVDSMAEDDWFDRVEVFKHGPVHGTRHANLHPRKSLYPNYADSAGHATQS